MRDTERKANRNSRIDWNRQMSEKIYRLHYRGQLKENISAEELAFAIENCKQNIRMAQRQGKVLTAALYHADRMLFFYYEALGEQLEVTEPIAIRNEQMAALEEYSSGDAVNGLNLIPESGEDVQTTCLHPEELLVALSPYLQIWPGQADERLWVHMYHIYYHDKPTSMEQWARASVPELRRGRIAFLRDDKLFSYVYYHKALVDEGLLLGDRYQSIALHENILFSYFEEPKTMCNVAHDFTRQSEVINEWLAVDPESHFIHMPQGKGENFMFLPALFALGVEDLA